MQTQLVLGIMVCFATYVVFYFILPIFRFIRESEEIFDLYEDELKSFFSLEPTEVLEEGNEELEEIREALNNVEMVIDDLLDAYEDSQIEYFLESHEIMGLTAEQRKTKLIDILYEIRMWQWYNKDIQS